MKLTLECDRRTVRLFLLILIGWFQNSINISIFQ